MRLVTLDIEGQREIERETLLIRLVRWIRSKL